MKLDTDLIRRLLTAILEKPRTRGELLKLFPDCKRTNMYKHLLFLGDWTGAYSGHKHSRITGKGLITRVPEKLGTRGRSRIYFSFKRD